MDELTVRFLARFISKLNFEGQELYYVNGILQTKGCTGEFGGCCAEHFDLSALLGDLFDLFPEEIPAGYYKEKPK